LSFSRQEERGPCPRQINRWNNEQPAVESKQPASQPNQANIASLMMRAFPAGICLSSEMDTGGSGADRWSGAKLTWDWSFHV
jgi:hypothetical protein